MALTADLLSILNHTEITVIGRGSCNKARACSNVAGENQISNGIRSYPMFLRQNFIINSALLGTYAFFGPNCCNGELACEGATSANMTVLQDSCNMKEACRGSSGK